MTTPITPDERAAMRERYTADLPSAWDTSVAAHGRALRAIGTSARDDVPRLLDALDTAEAERDEARERVKDEVRRVENFRRLEREAARRNLERAERSEAEVERLRIMLGDCHCDKNPETTNGPEEDCPQHGRPVAEVWGLVKRAEAKAWDEGFAAGVNADLGDYEHPPEIVTNPYREENTDD